MKKIILLSFILFGFFTNSLAQNVNIPDANFKAYLVGNSAINTNGDSEIQISEANVFSGTIKCGNLSISDLTGIEAFTNLTILACSNNTLTNLDVSNNTNLIELACSYNSLTTLDVSNNTNLTYLGCHFNSIGSLDISNHTNLTQLSCTYNSLTTLDVRNNNNLTYLSCSNNSLTRLNVANGNNTNLGSFNATNCPNLTCIQVDDTSWSKTNWASSVDNTASFSLDCGCIVNIPDANFKAYLVGNAAINTNGDSAIQCSEAEAFTGTIDCSYKIIQDLTGIESFVNITELNCETNYLTTLDISDLNSLIYLKCDNNKLTTIKLANNSSLNRLRATYNLIDSVDVTGAPNLATLNLVNNKLSSIYLSDNQKILSLNVSNNLLSSLDITKLKLIHSLSCYGNQISSLDLENNDSLYNVHVSNNLLNELDFNKHSRLITLQCENNLLTSLSLKNGNNKNFPYSNSFKAKNNPNLSCIEVDDTTWSNANWTNKDTTASFSENCSGSADIKNLRPKSVSVYPNPAHNTITLDLPTIKSATIISLQGKVFLQETNSNTLNIESLPIGMYIIKALDGEQIYTTRFIKN